GGGVGVDDAPGGGIDQELDGPVPLEDLAIEVVTRSGAFRWHQWPPAQSPHAANLRQVCQVYDTIHPPTREPTGVSGAAHGAFPAGPRRRGERPWPWRGGHHVVSVQDEHGLAMKPRSSSNNQWPLGRGSATLLAENRGQRPGSPSPFAPPPGPSTWPDHGHRPDPHPRHRRLDGDLQRRAAGAGAADTGGGAEPAGGGVGDRPLPRRLAHRRLLPVLPGLAGPDPIVRGPRPPRLRQTALSL